MAGLAPLNALRAFEAAARQGGFVGAAEELNVTPAAVGQQVRQLEALIGEALFERQGKTLILTERGAAALEPLRRGFELMGEASAALRAMQATPTLTLAADHDVMIAWLGRDLASTDAAIRLVARGEEAELTLTRSSVATAPAGADRIMDEVLTPLARPGLVAPDAGLAVLETLPLIEDSASGLSWAQWLSARGGYGLEAQPRLRAADSLAAGAACAVSAAMTVPLVNGLHHRDSPRLCLQCLAPFSVAADRPPQCGIRRCDLGLRAENRNNRFESRASAAPVQG